jgi:hypothetical protein
MIEDRSHAKYIEVLRKMTPEQRVLRTFELSDFVRQIFFEGLKKTFPNLSSEELKKLYLKRLELCHNRNY